MKTETRGARAKRSVDGLCRQTDTIRAQNEADRFRGTAHTCYVI
jgi:hypothetical protein